MKGLYQLESKFEKVQKDSRFISEITLAKLKFGVQSSQFFERNQVVLDDFLTGVNILPILPTLDFYAKEKARLRKVGLTLDEFDLLIGCCAVINKLTLITNNARHFERIEGIQLENWVKA